MTRLPPRPRRLAAALAATISLLALQSLPAGAQTQPTAPVRSLDQLEGQPITLSPQVATPLSQPSPLTGTGGSPTVLPTTPGPLPAETRTLVVQTPVPLPSPTRAAGTTPEPGASPVAGATAAVPTPTPSWRITEGGETAVDRRDLTPAEAVDGLLPEKFAAQDLTPSFRIPLVDPSGGGAEMFFRGEFLRKDYKVHVPAELVDQPAELVIGYISDIDVLERDSLMKVEVNGQPVREPLPLNAYGEIARISIPLDQVSLRLKPGENIVSVTVRQFDRNKCSLRSSNDMWTQVFPDLTYIDFPNPVAPQPELSRGFLRWGFGASFDGLAPVGMLTVEQPSKNQDWQQILTASLYAAQAVGHYGQPMVPDLRWQQVPRGAGGGALPGLAGAALTAPRNILVGTASELSGIVSAEISGQITGPYLGVVPVDTPAAATGQGFVLVVSGTTPAEVALAAEWLARPDLDPARMPRTAQRLQEALQEQPGTDLSTPVAKLKNGRGEVTVALTDLGYRERYYDYSTAVRADGWYDGVRLINQIPLDLPPDFFVSDDSTVEIVLEYEHDASLGEGSVFNIFINDKLDSSAGTPLAVAEARGPTTLRLAVPLRDFRPGRNLIGIEANLPIIDKTAEEDPCDFKGQRRFRLSEKGTLTFPRFPVLAELPNLGTFSTTAFPLHYPGEVQPRPVYLAEVLPSTLEAAWILTAKLAEQSQARLPMVATFNPPTDSNEHALIVGPFQSIEDRLFTNSPVTKTEIRSAWDALALPDFLVRTQVRDDAPVYKGPTFETYAPQRLNVERLEELRAAYLQNRRLQAVLEAEDQARLGSPIAVDSGFVGRLYGSTRRFFELDETGEISRAELLRVGLDDPTNIAKQEQTATAALLQFRAVDRNPNRAAMMLTAANADYLRAAARRLVTPVYWEQLSGEMMAFGPNALSIRTIRPRDRFHILTEDLSVSNLRLITSNWLSRSTTVWAVVVLGLLLVVAGLNWLLVRRVGQNSILRQDRP